MLKKGLVIAVFGLIGWGICGGIINVGRSLIGTPITLIIHAIAVPIVFGILSFLYHRNFHYTRPLQTGLIFTGLAMLLDAGIIAPLAEHSYVMFTSLLGTWIPFGLIFLVTTGVGWITRQAVGKRQSLPA
jgi:hypothetical protein